MKYQVASHTLTGSRPINQDRTAYAERDNAILLALADGLGGHAGGELASELFIQVVLRAFNSIKQPIIENPSAFLALTIFNAHRAIHAFGKARKPPIEPRTTGVLCLVQNGYAYWAHVGDSRLYHFRRKQLLQRTMDHTPVEELHRDGLISEEEMTSHPHKGRLLKCIGGPRKPVISLGEEALLKTGDTLLLCSDGLWEALPPEDFVNYINVKSLEEGIEELLISAEEQLPNSDNITAICLRWDDKTTTELPLQANKAIQINQDQIWQEAKNRLVGQKLQQKQQVPAMDIPTKGKPKPRRKGKKAEIESTIKELEEYIQQFESK